MNELNISNEALLDELGKRIKENQIKLQGRQLITKAEKGDNTYYAYTFWNMNIGNIVNTIIGDLNDEIKILRKENERWEKELVEYKKQLKTGS